MEFASHNGDTTNEAIPVGDHPQTEGVCWERGRWEEEEKEDAIAAAAGRLRYDWKRRVTSVSKTLTMFSEVTLGSLASCCSPYKQ